MNGLSMAQMEYILSFFEDYIDPIEIQEHRINSILQQLRTRKDFLENGKITILSDFIIEDNLAEVLLVVTSDRAGKMQIYQTSDISQFAKYPNKWYRAVYDELIIISK